jgi:hypothetical protein
MENNIKTKGLTWDRKRSHQLDRQYCDVDRLLFRCEQKLKSLLPNRIVKCR